MTQFCVKHFKNKTMIKSLFVFEQRSRDWVSRRLLAVSWFGKRHGRRPTRGGCRRCTGTTAPRTWFKIALSETQCLISKMIRSCPKKGEGINILLTMQSHWCRCLQNRDPWNKTLTYWRIAEVNDTCFNCEWKSNASVEQLHHCLAFTSLRYIRSISSTWI